jgi:hypothetical protein
VRQKTFSASLGDLAMNFNRILQSIRASKNISYAINEGRAPRQRDLAVLGLEDIFDAQRHCRKPLG